MLVARGALVAVLLVATVHGQYGPPRKKKPHAPLPPLEPSPAPSVPFVASSPAPDGNSLEPGRGDYWWMSSGGSIFSQPGPAPPAPQGCGGGAGGGGCGGGGVSPGNPFIPGSGAPAPSGCGGGSGNGGCGGGNGINPNNPFIGGGAPSGPSGPGCGGGSGGGCGGSGSGGSGYPNNPFLGGGSKPSGGSQVQCSEAGHICVPKQHCRNGIVLQDNQVVNGPCNTATHVCCYRPASAPSPPGCTGPPGKFVCGGLGPDTTGGINLPEGRQPNQPGQPGQPGLVHIAPGSPGSPGSATYNPGNPSQPGLIHIPPGRPGAPGSHTPGQPGQPGQPGIVHIAPGKPGTPGSATYTPGQPGTPGSATYTPGQPGTPGSATYIPGQPAQPGSVTYTPGKPAQPGSVTYTPGQPAQPGSVTYTPGQPAQPGSATYTPSGQPSQPGLVHISPPSRPGYGSPGTPVRPGTAGVPIGGSIYDATPRPPQSSATQQPYTGPLNTTPYPGCAAALKCVPENLCTVEGVMTDRPVTLTRDQLESRVPLTDCADPETGALGKCCRDPNYKDPWPGGMMMGPGHPGAHPGQHDHPGQHTHPDECGPAATCLHSYQCADANKVAPAKSCRVPLDGATGVCCSSDGSANFPTASGSAPQPTVKPGSHYYNPGKPAQPGSASYKPGTPAQPGSAIYTPGSPAQPGSASYQPGSPAQPGSVSYQPGTPAQPGSVTYQPGTPAQPGSASYQPGTPAQPGSASYQPGTPAQPGSASYQPGTPAQPGSASYQPGTPAQPGSASYQPGTSAQPGSTSYQPGQPGHPGIPGQPGHPGNPGQPGTPGSVTYTPGSPAQPGSASYKPGTPAQPGSVSYQPGTPAQPGSISYQPGTPAQPGSVVYQPGTPAHSGSASYQPGSEAQPSTVSPVVYEPVGPNNPSGPNCGIGGPILKPGQSPVEAGLGEFPWQVLVLSSANGSALCSGALVSYNAVATSAHCLAGARSSQLLVIVGAWRLGAHEAGARELRVAAVALHPSFDAGSLAHDLALLLLEQALAPQVAVPVCLPPAGQPADAGLTRSCVATGWGKTALQGNLKGSPLHKVPVSFVPHSQCEQILRQTHLGKYFQLNKGCQCALPKSPEYDLCLVDAGGPIGCDRGDGRYFLMGLYSWDVGCTSKTSPAVTAEVDVAWIQSVLSKPIDVVAQEEEEEARHKETVGQSPEFDTDSKPGFSQGYGRK